VVVVNATPVEVEVEQKIEASPIPESRPTNQVHNHSNNQKVIEPSALPSSSTNTYKYRCTACQQIFHTIERQTTPARCTRPECISRRKQDKFSTLNKNSKQILEQYELKRVSSVE
jgi:DNA-directed RNA polymerase subunit RPC12/RpoP